MVVFEPDDTHGYSRFKVGRKKSDTENYLLNELPFQLSSEDQLVGTDGITIDKAADSEKIEISGKNFVEKNTSTTGAHIYAHVLGEEVMRSFGYEPAYDNFPVYNANKTLKTSTPVENQDAANKKYVDDAIKAAGTNNLYEANLNWGGKNLVDRYSPTDAAMIPELGANRFAGLPAKAVTIEYSRDSGSTWVDYGASDSTKRALFTTSTNLIIGKNEDNSDPTNY